MVALCGTQLAEPRITSSIKGQSDFGKEHLNAVLDGNLQVGAIAEHVCQKHGLQQKRYSEGQTARSLRAELVAV
eukprot:9223881-Alexandrium_andersonii.AAC.1